MEMTRRGLAAPLLIVVRAVGIVAVIILCVIAQSQFLVDRSENGYLWLAAAGVVAFLIVVPAVRQHFTLHDPESMEIARGLRRWLGIILLVVGAAIVIYGARLFHEQLLVSIYVHDSSWIIYSFGLVVMLVGALVLTRFGRLPRFDITVWLLVIVLAAAVFVRVYRVDIYP